MNDPKVEKQPPVPPFVQFCCAAIPQVFDDSLSYYEALCAMWKYLDETRQVVNNNATVTEEQIVLYNELKEYVDNYFENLDVQAEINAKLDAMALDGSLTALIGAYVQPLIDEQNNNINNFESSITSDFNTYKNQVNTSINNINTQVQAVASGSPLVATSTAEMTDTTRVYVNTTDGKWYYYDGDSWEIGGTYQSTGIALASIVGAMLKSATITKDKLEDVISVLSKATSIEQGKAVTTINTSTGAVLVDNVTTNVATFDYDDLKDLTVFFKVDSATTSGGTGIRLLHYNSSDLTDHTSTSYSSLMSGTNYDSETGCIILTRFPSREFDTTVITLNADFEIYVKPAYETPALIAGDSVKVKSSDLRKYGDITYGKALQGYDLTTYLPDTTNNWKFNELVIQLTGDNINRVSNSYLYIPDSTSSVTKRIMFYKENTRCNTYNLSTILASSGYDATTKRVNIGALVGTNITKYDYVAIFYEESIEQCPVYTTYLTPADPNYDLSISNPAYNFDVVLPTNVKAVENQTLEIYFQNIIRYQNADIVPYKEIQDAYLNNDRMAILDTSNTGSYTKAFSTKEVFNAGAKSYNFNYQVIPANAGSGSNKKVLCIGDSLTATAKYTKRLLELFADDAMDITLLGSMHPASSETNRYEGLSGWSTVDYATKQTYNDKTNPFYNPSTSAFDFSYYMTQQSYSGVDYVFINLGTNDILQESSDTISAINAMVTSILAYDSDIKIGLWLPPNRGITEDNQLKGLNDMFNAMRINKLYIDTYSSSPDVTLIPVNLNVNPYKDYPVVDIPVGLVSGSEYSVPYTDVSNSIHPNDNGYYHIADVLYTWIKYFASL